MAVGQSFGFSILAKVQCAGSYEIVLGVARWELLQADSRLRGSLSLSSTRPCNFGLNFCASGSDLKVFCEQFWYPREY